MIIDIFAPEMQIFAHTHTTTRVVCVVKRRVVNRHKKKGWEARPETNGRWFYLRSGHAPLRLIHSFIRGGPEKTTTTSTIRYDDDGVHNRAMRPGIVRYVGRRG